MEYHPGEYFSFDLNLNADAGYQWNYSINDTNVAKIINTNYRPYSGNWNQVGGLTIETFYCCTYRPGICVFTLREQRPWLPNVPAIDSLCVLVVVNYL